MGVRYCTQHKKDCNLCDATSKQTGNPCKQHPTPGSNVCHDHGGYAPQVKRKAEQRLALQQASTEALSILGTAGTDQDPLEHALEALHQAKYMEITLGLVIDRRRQEQGDKALINIDAKQTQTVDALLAELRQWVTLRANIANQLMRAGVAERQVRITELQTAQMVQRLRGCLTELGHNPDTQPHVIASIQHWFSGDIPTQPRQTTLAA